MSRLMRRHGQAGAGRNEPSPAGSDNAAATDVQECARSLKTRLNPAAVAVDMNGMDRAAVTT